MNNSYCSRTADMIRAISWYIRSWFWTIKKPQTMEPVFYVYYGNILKKRVINTSFCLCTLTFYCSCNVNMPTCQTLITLISGIKCRLWNRTDGEDIHNIKFIQSLPNCTMCWCTIMSVCLCPLQGGSLWVSLTSLHMHTTFFLGLLPIFTYFALMVDDTGIGKFQALRSEFQSHSFTPFCCYAFLGT